MTCYLRHFLWCRMFYVVVCIERHLESSDKTCFLDCTTKCITFCGQINTEMDSRETEAIASFYINIDWEIKAHGTFIQIAIQETV